VTGGTGFLGGWLVRALVERESRPVVIIRDNSPQNQIMRTGLLDRIEAVFGSVSDPELLRRTIAEYSVQTIFHLAAQTQVGVAKMDPVGSLEANVRGSWNVLEAARQFSGVQVIAASSDKAYGDSDCLPYTENLALRGKYPYDVSKTCMDLICTMYAASFSLPVGITRCANLFGGWDQNFDRLIPGVIASTLRGERFVIRSDGQFIRDYLYVEDAVDAYLLLAECLAENPSLRGEAFNFSSGERRTVIDVVHNVLRLLDRSDLEPVILSQVSLEIREQYLLGEKAQRILGWTPRVGFEEGLRRTIDWYRASRTNGSRPAPYATVTA
jgi:CDP-glucose 4,6-dehydratase